MVGLRDKNKTTLQAISNNHVEQFVIGQAYIDQSQTCNKTTRLPGPISSTTTSPLTCVICQIVTRHSFVLQGKFLLLLYGKTRPRQVNVTGKTGKWPLENRENYFEY